MPSGMDNSLDLILASATPIALVMPLGLSKIQSAQHDKLLVAYAQKKAANITLSCDLGHVETALRENFFSQIVSAIKL